MVFIILMHIEKGTYCYSSDSIIWYYHIILSFCL